MSNLNTPLVYRKNKTEVWVNFPDVGDHLVCRWHSDSERMLRFLFNENWQEMVLRGMRDELNNTIIWRNIRVDNVEVIHDKVRELVLEIMKIPTEELPSSSDYNVNNTLQNIFSPHGEEKTW